MQALFGEPQPYLRIYVSVLVHVCTVAHAYMYLHVYMYAGASTFVQGRLYMGFIKGNGPQRKRQGPRVSQLVCVRVCLDVEHVLVCVCA